MIEYFCGIYCIENTINKKRYVGFSKNIKRRWRDHIRELDSGVHVNRYLQNSWIKYGKDVFIFYILEECEEEDLIKKEIYWIDKLKSRNTINGFNMNDGGLGNLGMFVSEKVRKKISAINSGENNGMFGKKHSKETRDVFSKQRIGNTNGVGNKNNLGLIKKYKNSSSSYYGVFKSTYIYKKNKRIVWKCRFNLNGKEIKIGTFSNKIDAARAWDRVSWENHKDLEKLNFPEDYQ